MSRKNDQRDPQPDNKGEGGAEGGAGSLPGAKASRPARAGAPKGATGGVSKSEGKSADASADKRLQKGRATATTTPRTPRAEHRKAKKTMVNGVPADVRSTLIRKHRWNQVPDHRQFMLFPENNSASGEGSGDQVATMELPLFPLKNVVLFPGMVLPLHIFEARYREMIAKCIEEKSQFGVVLIADGDEVGVVTRLHMVGTAARITKVDKLEDGRMNILAFGTQRFQVIDVDESGAYLKANVRPLPIVNGGTRIAAELVQKVRPRIFEYVELLSEAMKQKLPLDRLPEDPATLAMLVAIGIQVNAEDKQRLLEKNGVPEMLAHEAWMLSREALLLRHMLDTQQDVQRMNSGPTGYIFPN